MQFVFFSNIILHFCAFRSACSQSLWLSRKRWSLKAANHTLFHCSQNTQLYFHHPSQLFTSNIEEPDKYTSAFWVQSNPLQIKLRWESEPFVWDAVAVNLVYCVWSSPIPVLASSQASLHKYDPPLYHWHLFDWLGYTLNTLFPIHKLIHVTLPVWQL